MIRRIAIAVWLVAPTLPAAAVANTMEGNWMINRWSASDKCAAAARRAFPDYTAEANAKRDAQFQRCLAGQNLPPRGSLDTGAPTKP